jgi:hypothetical protein
MPFTGGGDEVFQRTGRHSGHGRQEKEEKEFPAHAPTLGENALAVKTCPSSDRPDRRLSFGVPVP